MQRSLRILFLQKYVFFLFHQTSNKRKQQMLAHYLWILLFSSNFPGGEIHFPLRENPSPCRGKFCIGMELPCLYFCDLNFMQNIHSFTKPIFTPKPAKQEKNCVKKHPNFFPETFPKGPFFIGTGAISNLSAANFRHPAANRQEDGRSCDYDRPNQ